MSTQTVIDSTMQNKEVTLLHNYFKNKPQCDLQLPEPEASNSKVTGESAQIEH